MVACLTDEANDSIKVRLGLRRDVHGKLRVARMLARVDFVYEEEWPLSEGRERARHPAVAK